MTPRHAHPARSPCRGHKAGQVSGPVRANEGPGVALSLGAHLPLRTASDSVTTSRGTPAVNTLAHEEKEANEHVIL